MAELFKKIVGNPTEQEKENMVKTGTIPTQYKSPENKKYITLLKTDFNFELFPGISVDAEAIIEIGRESMFDRIKEIIEYDLEDAIFDLDTSEVLVEGVEAGSSVSLKQFIIMCNKAYPDKEIDVDYYLSLIEDSNKSINTPDATGFGTSGTLLD